MLLLARSARSAAMNVSSLQVSFKLPQNETEIPPLARSIYEPFRYITFNKTIELMDEEIETKILLYLLYSFPQMLMNAWMETCTTVRMSSTSASTLAARTSANVNKICILLMANAEVISDELLLAIK